MSLPAPVIISVGICRELLYHLRNGFSDKKIRGLRRGPFAGIVSCRKNNIAADREAGLIQPVGCTENTFYAVTLYCAALFFPHRDTEAVKGQSVRYKIYCKKSAADIFSRTEAAQKYSVVLSCFGKKHFFYKLQDRIKIKIKIKKFSDKKTKDPIPISIG